MIEASAPTLKAFRRKWVTVLLALGGAGTFLYAGFRPIVDSPLVCCPGLLGPPGLESRTLTDAIPLLIPVLALGVAIRLMVSADGGPSIARGVLFSAGLVGAALFLQEAGGLIAIKGGVPASGALLGFSGASLILVAAILWPQTRHFDTSERRPTRTLRVLVPLGILLGAGMFVAAVLMPWTYRPFPLRLVSLPGSSSYWIWSMVLSFAILLPLVFAGIRLLLANRQRRFEVGVALGGGIFATLLFVQRVGTVLASSFPDDFFNRPPVFTLTTWGYLGLGAGGLILASTLVGSLSLRR